MDNSISLVIVEDDAIMRETFTTYFQRDKDLIRNVVSFDSVEALLNEENFDNYKILLDINLPGMTGIEGISHIKKKFANIEILIISVLTDSQNIFDAICAGASGYLDKDTSLLKIKEAIINVHEGGSAITPAIARKVFDHFQPSNNIAESLTDRESQVVSGIVDGLSYKLIADRMEISINTIRKYIRQIYHKLQINSKSELITKFHNPNRI